MAGRFAWSSTSDYLGRKPIYMVYLGVGIVLYVVLALSGSAMTAVFVLVAAIIISFYGGGFATAPAYLRDLFGVFQVGAIHGRLLTAWAAAGVAGPLIVNGVLDRAGDPGTLTADAYRPALLIMVVVLAVGFVANLLITPVDTSHHTDRGEERAPATEERDSALATEQTAPATTSARLVLSWGVVGLLLAYGVYETVSTALNLF